MWKQPTHLRGAILTSVVCVLWILLAVGNPYQHFHLLPLVASMLWPLSLRNREQRSGREAVIGGSSSAGLVLLTTLGIQLAEQMKGPNYLDQGPAWPEAVLFALVGAAIGALIASRT